jgi:hypothetical protein
MTCPRCFAVFDVAPAQRPASCPECGVQLLRNVSGMLKTSAVMISAAGENGFYRSVQDVPEPLRQQLLRVTASENSGTIVIADRAGKEQLTQVVTRRDSAHEISAAAPSASLNPGYHGLMENSFLGLSWIVWAGIFLLLGSAAVVTAVFAIHW